MASAMAQSNDSSGKPQKLLKTEGTDLLNHNNSACSLDSGFDIVQFHSNMVQQ